MNSDQPEQPQTQATSQRSYATAPLGDPPVPHHRPEAVAPPPEPADLEATRPLPAKNAPAEEHIELASTSLAPTHTPGLLAAALRDVGMLRSVNQDHVYALTTTLPRGESDMLMGLFVVADGMGGHDAGEVASLIAIGTIARMVLADLVVPALEESFGAALQQLIVDAVREANRAIWDHGRSTGLDLGTTCTAALVIGRTLYIGHVGDSRAYLVEDGQIHQLTTDHSAVGRLIALGQLDPSEAREHPMRSQLYRTIGQTADVHVDLVQRPLGNASHLLLCSDGLWSMLDDPAIASMIAAAVRPEDACRQLIDAANAAGGEDNISALVVQL